MNEYDSAKMHDVLTESEDIIRVATPEEADILLLNTFQFEKKRRRKFFLYWVPGKTGSGINLIF